MLIFFADEDCCSPSVIHEISYNVNMGVENIFSPICRLPSGEIPRWLSPDNNAGGFTIDYCKIRYASGFQIQNSYNPPTGFNRYSQP